MRNIVMSVSYDGTDYNGFQSQPNRNTVQDKLELAVEKLTGERVKLQASGRTDAGVHARAQVINFLTESAIPVERWCLAINSRLPGDIVANDAKEAELDFHARYSAKRKTYRYTIHRAKFPDVFHRRFRFHHPMPLNVESMAKALELLQGEHDFTSFCSVNNQTVGSHVRTIYDARIEYLPEQTDEDGDAGVIHIYVTGNGFLYNMVRIIAGTLMQIGEGRRPFEDMQRILNGKNRRLAGPRAMAHGLMLWDVVY